LLTFFVELEGAALQQLFADPDIIDHLKALNARISLGIVDLSPQRADVVRRLNQAGIPVIAWQLLPQEQGYWYNMCNASQAVTRYQEFQQWSLSENLSWQGIGVDIEPDISELKYLFNHKFKFIRALFKRGCSKKRLLEAQKIYHSLVEQMQSDGNVVYSYEFPFMVDEKRAGSTLLRRIFGVTDIPSDKRVLMLYTSFFRPIGTSFLCCYSKEAHSVAIGITGGGVEIEGVTHPPSLNWEELSRDMRLAAKCCHDIHIFSLEGCIEQGFLERLHDFDWYQPTTAPHPMMTVLNMLRLCFMGMLWLTTRPTALVMLLFISVGLFVF
jgi:hypothetical protein